MTDLCTLAHVRERRQTATADVGQDTLVGRVIAGVSAAIAREYKREFTPTTAAARMFELRAGATRVTLSPYEIRTVTLVRVNPDQATPADLAAADYRLSPRPAEDGTYHVLEMRASALPTDDTGFDNLLVQVTGDWGMAAIPDDVREAAIISTVHNMRTSVGQYSIADGAGGETRYERAEIPQAAHDLLTPYRRHQHF